MRFLAVRLRGKDVTKISGLSMSEARAGLQEQLAQQADEVRQARESLVREVGALRRDMEEKAE